MHHRFSTSLALVAVAALAAAAVSCATAVDNIGTGGGDPITTTGGDGGSTTSSSSVGTTTGTGTGPCVKASDCAGVSDQCNVGTCINGMCEKVPANDLTGCDDGKECSTNDACQAGVCTGTPKFCPSTDACHVGSCDLATDSCVQVPGNDGGGCIDNDPCTLSGTCSNGVCAPGQLVDCSFLDSVCGVGTCDPQLGCVATPLNDGSPCDDGFYCTIDDTCTGGVCSGDPNTCAPPGDICLIGTCNEAQNTCVAVPGNNGLACDDSNSCTASESCSNGVCGGGQIVNQGLACSDGDACTVNETCQNGNCAGTTINSCLNNDGCCAAGCTNLNDNDCTCQGWVYNGGCWYTAAALNMSCNQVCAAHGGFDAVHTQHNGNAVGKHFWPAKADGSDWETIECSSTDNNTNWGANGTPPNPDWIFGACYVNCACMF